MRLFMKIITICFLGLIILAPNIALSHSNHGVLLNEERALVKATQEVKRLVEQQLPIEGEKKLDSSWTTVSTKQAIKVSRFFIVGFYHPEKQKTLFVLLEMTGEFLKANFSGKFF